VVVATASNRLFRRLCTAIGRPDLATDPLYRTHRDRAANRALINSIVGEWVGARTCDEVLRILGPGGAAVPVARVVAPEELVDDAQLRARGSIETHPHPTLGEIHFHGNPLRFSDAVPRERPLAPGLGADNESVYGGLGLTATDLQRLAEAGVI
jgi:crotonobetainyl-CoA:carnitine CoA-transferase CaiB-like acyl-CoA transferase